MALVWPQAGGGAYVVAASIHELSAEDTDAIRQFNARLGKAGVSFAFPAAPSELMLAEPAGDVPYQTAYVLADGPAVRGGYILKPERISSSGEWVSAGNYQLPLSEGIIERKYAMVGLQLLKDALARQPRLYCLGMGGTARPLPQLLKRLGWAVSEVPFLFRVEQPGTFAREIRWLRQRARLRLLLDIAHRTGVLAAMVGLTHLRRWVSGRRVPADVSIDQVQELPSDIDEIFLRLRGDYGLLCDRTAAAMRQKLPQDPKLVRLILSRSGKAAGWIVLSLSHLKNHTQFGNMTLGCVVDGLAAIADVDILVAEACRRLEAGGCDLLVSNQSHPAWIGALRRQGFLQGPSNFVLALSPPLAAARETAACAHFNRADGDGPINL
jgi:hypothetical protein